MEKENIFLIKYYEEFINLISPKFQKHTIELKKEILKIRNRGKKIIIAGNGGSAAIASHFSVDLTKNAKVRCINFNEADLLTCFSNDYGYEKWIENAIKYYCDKGDMLILVSSSGESKNIVNAAKYFKKKKLWEINYLYWA